MVMERRGATNTSCLTNAELIEAARGASIIINVMKIKGETIPSALVLATGLTTCSATQRAMIKSNSLIEHNKLLTFPSSSWLHSPEKAPRFWPKPSSACTNASFYPNLNAMLTILLTIPVLSAILERSFSSMRRVETYLRATVTIKTERLSALALLHAYRDMAIDREDLSRRAVGRGGGLRWVCPHPLTCHKDPLNLRGSVKMALRMQEKWTSTT